MPPVIGNIIVISILTLVVFFSARATIRGIKRELNGGGCASCGGSCSGSCGDGTCAACSSYKPDKKAFQTFRKARYKN